MESQHKTTAYRVGRWGRDVTQVGPRVTKRRKSGFRHIRPATLSYKSCFKEAKWTNRWPQSGGSKHDGDLFASFDGQVRSTTMAEATVHLLNEYLNIILFAYLTDVIN